LIELLTVIAIILLLVGLLLPALTFARNQARKHVARQDMSNMYNALLSFRQEYGYWPSTSSWTELGTMLNGNIHPYTGAGAASGSWASNNNPKAIRFLEFKTNQVSSTGQYLDPWGDAYYVLMDHGGAAVEKAGWSDLSQPPGVGGTTGPEDGMVSHPRTTVTNLQTCVAIYSIGSNKQDDLADQNYFDDVSSWNESP
jgi:type II secretory pathway pseudopilin PulG